MGLAAEALFVRACIIEFQEAVARVRESREAAARARSDWLMVAGWIPGASVRSTSVNAVDPRGRLADRIESRLRAGAWPSTKALADLVRDGHLQLPREARELGGRIRAGMGEYYPQLIAPSASSKRIALATTRQGGGNRGRMTILHMPRCTASSHERWHSST